MKVLFFDIETTGSWLHSTPFAKFQGGKPVYWDDAVSISVGDADGNIVYSTYISPSVEYWIHRDQWWKIDGVYNVDPANTIGEPTMYKVVQRKLKDLFDSADIVVAHNASFDTKVLLDSYVMSPDNGRRKTTNLSELFDTEFVCSKVLSKDHPLFDHTTHYDSCFAGNAKCNGSRLTHLHHQFGFGDYAEHDASADVKALANVWSVLSDIYDGSTGNTSYVCNLDS